MICVMCHKELTPIEELLSSIIGGYKLGIGICQSCSNKLKEKSKDRASTIPDTTKTTEN